MPDGYTIVGCCRCGIHVPCYDGEDPTKIVCADCLKPGEEMEIPPVLENRFKGIRK